VLFLRSGRVAPISDLSSATVSIRVFNFQVAEHHTYAVGQAGVLVHNKAKAYQRAYHGPKSQYTNPGTHDPTSPNFVKGKTPLPADAEAVYRRAIPDPANTTPTKQKWFGRSSSGEYYRYQGDNGEVHFNGKVDWNDLPTYIKERYRDMGFTK
jgi:hypothetical protein